jgi:hypothetical protein
MPNKIIIFIFFIFLNTFLSAQTPYQENNYWGYMGNNGKPLVTAIYDTVYPFAYNKGQVCYIRKQRYEQEPKTYRCGILDSTGKEIMDLVYDSVFTYPNGYLLAFPTTPNPYNQPPKPILYSPQGEKLWGIPENASFYFQTYQPEDSAYLAQGLFPVIKTQAYIRNLQTDTQIGADFIAPFDSTCTKFVVFKNYEYKIVDADKKPIVATGFEEFYGEFGNGKAPYFFMFKEKNNIYTAFDTQTLQPFWKGEAENLLTSRDTAILRINEKESVFLYAKNQQIRHLNFRYERVFNHQDYYLISRDKKYGLADKQFNVVLEPIYTNLMACTNENGGVQGRYNTTFNYPKWVSIEKDGQRFGFDLKTKQIFHPKHKDAMFVLLNDYWAISHCTGAANQRSFIQKIDIKNQKVLQVFEHSFYVRSKGYGDYTAWQLKDTAFFYHKHNLLFKLAKVSSFSMLEPALPNSPPLFKLVFSNGTLAVYNDKKQIIIQNIPEKIEIDEGDIIHFFANKIISFAGNLVVQNGYQQMIYNSQGQILNNFEVGRFQNDFDSNYIEFVAPRVIQDRNLKNSYLEITTPKELIIYDTNLRECVRVKHRGTKKSAKIQTIFFQKFFIINHPFDNQTHRANQDKTNLRTVYNAQNKLVLEDTSTYDLLFILKDSSLLKLFNTKNKAVYLDFTTGKAINPQIYDRIFQNPYTGHYVGVQNFEKQQIISSLDSLGGLVCRKSIDLHIKDPLNPLVFIDPLTCKELFRAADIRKIQNRYLWYFRYNRAYFDTKGNCIKNCD